MAGSLARPARPGKLDSIAGAGVLANRAVRLVAAVIKGNDTLLMKAYGRADVEWGVPKPAFRAIPPTVSLSSNRSSSAGEAQAYNNSGFWLLGIVVEKASGMKFEDYLEKQIFEPLGMKRSMYCNTSANVPRRAHGYGMLNEMIRRAPAVVYTWVIAPGAICSTAGDLVTWLQALHGGKVLSVESYAEMTRPSTLADGTTQFGMGIKAGEDYRGLRYIGHGGPAPASVPWAAALKFHASENVTLTFRRRKPTPPESFNLLAAFLHERVKVQLHRKGVPKKW